MKDQRIIFILVLLLALQTQISSNDLQPQNPFPGATTGPHFVGQTFYPAVDIYFGYDYPVNANEWYVSVDIFYGGQTVYSSTIPGVDRNTRGEIIGTLPLTASVPFTPTGAGNYAVLFEVYYQYDVDPSNDYVSADFPVFGPPGPIMGPSPPPNSLIDYSPAQSFIWGNCTNPITDSHVLLSPVNPSVGEVFSATLSNPTATTWTPPEDLQPSTTYELEILQSNPAGTTSNGPYSYTTEDEPCAPRVDIISPDNGATDLPLNPTDLMWTESENSSTESYSVYISPLLSGIDPSLADPVTITSPGHTSIPIPSDLIQPGTTLHARIGANCPDGSSYSDVSSFTFSDQNWPDPPQVLIPVDGSTVPFDPFIPVQITAPHPSPTGEMSTEIWLGTSQSDVSPEMAAPVTLTNDVHRTEFNLPGPFETNQEYFVRAVYICGDEPNTFQKLGDITQFFTSGASDISGIVKKTYAPNSSLVDVDPSLFDVEGNVEVVLPNGSTENVKKTTKPDSNGDFLIPELPPGDYTLQLTTPPEWTYLTPSSGIYQGTLESGQNIIDRNFIVIPPPSVVTGEKWQDDNADGEKDDSENRIPNWPITLDGTSFAGNAVNLSTVTDADGFYIFENVPPGNYTVSEGTLPGWQQSFPPAGVHNIVLDNGIPANDLDFGNIPPPGSISGYKFHDRNGNGERDYGEPGINGVEIKLFKDGVMVASQYTHSSDLDENLFFDPQSETGYFIFSDLEPGTYIITEEPPPGWIQTLPGDPGYYEVNLESDEHITDLLFGNDFPDGYDFGDLPEPFENITTCLFLQCYPTTLPFGAYHAAIGPTLGETRDSEPNGQPDLHALGDDKNNFDEDGVRFLSFVPGGIGTVEVTVRGAQDDFPCYLKAWIDFNGDGYLGFGSINPEENILSEKIHTTGKFIFEFNIPENLINSSFARFRLSTNENCIDLPYGPAIDGEVEDYFAYGFDFGDAPEPYPTKLVDGGAKHIIGNYYLGELIDSEFDGQPHIDALGDDNSGLNDEDGIKFITPLIRAQEAKVEVTVNSPTEIHGYLNAWIDFDGDGIWDSLNERIFSDVILLTGIDTLSFSVPDSSITGTTFARFRYSEFPGVNPTDYNASQSMMLTVGEVEDYKVVIDSLITSIMEHHSFIPQEFRLYQNYPNPFNPSTIIRYDVKEPSYVRLDVYNILGQLVTTLVNQVQTAGAYEAKFETNNLSAGIYFYSIRMSNYTRTMKMILMK